MTACASLTTGQIPKDDAARAKHTVDYLLSKGWLRQTGTTRLNDHIIHLWMGEGPQQRPA